MFSSGLDFGGSHSISSDTSGSATFTFTGVAIYYLAPRLPYAVNTELTLDGGQGVIVNLTDPNASPTPPGGSESAESSVAWSATGLSNTSHSLVLTMVPTGEFIIADGFIYTVNNGSSSAPSSSSTSSSSSRTRLRPLRTRRANDSSRFPSICIFNHLTYCLRIVIVFAHLRISAIRSHIPPLPDFHTPVHLHIYPTLLHLPFPCSAHVDRLTPRKSSLHTIFRTDEDEVLFVLRISGGVVLA
ncbi:hypothetical protein B0H11DRAFT_2284733 [Mycena galericulata]|nr:hypothetical protein B0H11DRAFT_2284733 [Mycena galericulata]